MSNLYHFATRELVSEVIRPALLWPDGLPRLQSLFERWLVWAQRGCYPGGCLFVAIAAKFDDQPGPVHNHLVRLYQAWHRLVECPVRAAVANGSLGPDTDLDQFLQDLHGIILGFHHRARLLRDPASERRSRRAFWSLVNRRASAGE